MTGTEMCRNKGNTFREAKPVSLCYTGRCKPLPPRRYINCCNRVSNNEQYRVSTITN